MLACHNKQLWSKMMVQSIKISSELFKSSVLSAGYRMRNCELLNIKWKCRSCQDDDMLICKDPQPSQHMHMYSLKYKAPNKGKQIQCNCLCKTILAFWFKSCRSELMWLNSWILTIKISTQSITKVAQQFLWPTQLMANTTWSSIFRTLKFSVL
jgi:hypothetical protein